jgi:1,4-dihydroxy-2-naphthoate octaprenyltransferase
MDVKTLIAGTVPVILGSIYSLYAFKKFNVLYFVLLIFAIILIQSSTNMINDYFDFKRGADNGKNASEKVLISGEMTSRQVLFIVAVYELIALAIGIFIAVQTSYYILLVAVVGGAISVLYASGPLPISYTPMGEIVSGITMGIGITTTVIYIQSNVVTLNTVLVAVPTALFIGTILLSNNLSDLTEDEKVGRKTLPIIIGIENAEKLWMISVISLIILTYILVIMHIYPLIVLIPVTLLFPYKSIYDFLSYSKNICTKNRTMGTIAKIGLKYHIAVSTGLAVAILNSFWS